MPGSDIFISYKSEQFSWAERLADGLTRYGFSVFVDHDTAGGLAAGEVWAEQLRQEISGATHFLLLWSSKIAVGSYVLQEIDIRRKAGLPITIARLDDSPVPSYLDSSVQSFRGLVDLAKAAGDDAATVGYFEWWRAVRQLVEAKPLADEPGAVVVDIPLVVVAMTHDQAVELAAGSNVVPGIKGGAFEQLMDLLKDTVPFDPDRYGARPEEWRPFTQALDANDWTVERVVSEFDHAKRSYQRNYPDDGGPGRYAFVPFTEALRDARTTGRAVQYLKHHPPLVVFDPVSLTHQEVYKEVIANGLHTMEKAFVIGLGPQISASSPPMRNYVGRVEHDLFDALMMNDSHARSRSIFQPTLSACVFNVCQGFELSRWLNVASEEIVEWTGKSRTRMAPEFENVVRLGRGTVPRLA